MNIFLTGGTGFIGKYILKDILSSGNNIKLAIRPSSLISLEQEFATQSLKIIRSDLDNIQSKDLEGIDLVLHIAAIGVSPQKASISQYLSVNVKDSLELFLKAEKAGVKRFVMTGTCHEYGLSCDKYKFIPPNAPLIPLTNYGSSKVAAFHLLRNYSLYSKMEFCYLRLFHIYGEGQYKKNFWSQLKSASLDGDNFVINNPDIIRDFLKVDMAAKKIIDKAFNNPMKPGSPIVKNIASGIPITLREFAKKEWKELGSKGNLIFSEVDPNHLAQQRIVAEINT